MYFSLFRFTSQDESQRVGLAQFIFNTIYVNEFARITPRYGCSMSPEPEEQEEKSHEGMSQDEARHGKDVKHHPHGEDAEKDE